MPRNAATAFDDGNHRAHGAILREVALAIASNFPLSASVVCAATLDVMSAMTRTERLSLHYCVLTSTLQGINVSS